MNRFARFAAITATSALALAAAPALAHDRDDHDRDCDRPAAAVYPAVPAPPAYAAPVYAPAPAPAPVVVRPVRWEGGRFRELRAEYRRLDEARDQFYATWHGNPWRRDRFEGWYASRRAELDHRWAELERHGRW